MSPENIQLARQMFAATWGEWQESGFDPAKLRLDHLHPDVEWETRWPGLRRFSHGREGVLEWVGQVLEPMAMHLELLDVRPIDDERVFLSIHVTGRGRGSGAPVEMDIWDIWTLRDGMIYRRQTFYDRPEALAAAGLAE
jgi:ketosteroid isomerase-like protein